MSKAAPAPVEQKIEVAAPPLSDFPRRVPGQPDRRVRRRASREQGQALERLGHAVEYLIDSRMFLTGKMNPAAEREAVQLLMRLSRSIFAECVEVVSVWEQVERLCRKSFARR
jgi:hypothetical protein